MTPLFNGWTIPLKKKYEPIIKELKYFSPEISQEYGLEIRDPNPGSEKKPIPDPDLDPMATNHNIEITWSNFKTM